MLNFTVKEIEKKLTHDFILNMHYARRLPSISYSYGLFNADGKLVGILTIGKPVSPQLCSGICGKEYSMFVFELNRLYTLNGLPKNTLSYFVSTVLKLLKDTKIIIVSYADSALHHGYIYQSTNWYYIGKTKQRTDIYTEPNKHSRHYNKDDVNNNLRKVRTSKYRYLYVPNKKFKKEVLMHLNYPIESTYPKGDNKNYKAGDVLKTLIIDKKNNTKYYE